MSGKIRGKEVRDQIAQSAITVGFHFTRTLFADVRRTNTNTPLKGCSYVHHRLMARTVSSRHHRRRMLLSFGCVFPSARLRWPAADHQTRPRCRFRESGRSMSVRPADTPREVRGTRRRDRVFARNTNPPRLFQDRSPAQPSLRIASHSSNSLSADVFSTDIAHSFAGHTRPSQQPTYPPPIKCSDARLKACCLPGLPPRC